MCIRDRIDTPGEKNTEYQKKDSLIAMWKEINGRSYFATIEISDDEKSSELEKLLWIMQYKF